MKNNIIAIALTITAGYLHTSNPHSKKPPLHPNSNKKAITAAPQAKTQKEVTQLMTDIQQTEAELAAAIASLPADHPGKKKLLEEFAKRSGEAYSTYNVLQHQAHKASKK